MVFSAQDQILIKVWSANSPDLNPVDYRIWGKLQERVCRNGIRDVDQLKSSLIEEWEQFQQSVINEAVKQLLASSSLHSSMRRTFQTQTLGSHSYCSVFLQRHSLTVNCLRHCL